MVTQPLTQHLLRAKTTSWRRDRPNGKKHHDDSEPRLNFHGILESSIESSKMYQNVLLLCHGTSMMLAIPACGLVMILHIALRHFTAMVSDHLLLRRSSVLPVTCPTSDWPMEANKPCHCPSFSIWESVTSIRRTCALKYSYWMPKPPMRLHSNLSRPKKPVGGADHGRPVQKPSFRFLEQTVGWLSVKT